MHKGVRRFFDAMRPWRPVFFGGHVGPSTALDLAAQEKQIIRLVFAQDDGVFEQGVAWIAERFEPVAWRLRYQNIAKSRAFITRLFQASSSAPSLTIF